MARPQPEPLRVVERLDCLEHAIEVEERLAHAHEHDVREAPAPGGHPAGGVADLVEDLGQVARPERAGGDVRLAGHASDRSVAARTREGTP